MRLEGVLGQTRAQAQLNAEIAAGRLAHAYLFVGPRGVGRATAARALFAAANCEEKDADTPCGRCGPCRRLAAGTHEDLITLAPPHDSPSAQIKVDDLRQALRLLGFPPFAGGVRMILIKEAGHLNPASSGALLKSLEEPPPGNILVLTVQDPAEIPATLVSRCRRVGFTPLDIDLVIAALIERGADPKAARLQAAMSAGSLGRAQELDQEALAAELERLEEHLRKGADPSDDWALAEELVAAFKGPQRMDRQGLADSLDLWAQYCRDLAVTDAGRPQAAVLAAGSAAGADLAGPVQGFELVRQAQNQILANASPELVLATLLGQLRELGLRAG